MQRAVFPRGLLQLLTVIVLLAGLGISQVAAQSGQEQAARAQRLDELFALLKTAKEQDEGEEDEDEAFARAQSARGKAGEFLEESHRSWLRVADASRRRNGRGGAEAGGRRGVGTVRSRSVE